MAVAARGHRPQVTLITVASVTISQIPTVVLAAVELVRVPRTLVNAMFVATPRELFAVLAVDVCLVAPVMDIHRLRIVLNVINAHVDHVADSRLHGVVPHAVVINAQSV